MPLTRFVYYTGIVGGWAALLAWLFSEFLFWSRSTAGGLATTLGTGALVGGILAAGLNVVSGVAHGQGRGQWLRALLGLGAGALGGCFGGLLGGLGYEWLGLSRAIGWCILGAMIGCADSVWDRSIRKLRNGLIGGAVGGLLGGLLFDPIAGAHSDFSSRAVGLVVLGISIGLMIGLAQVVLKEAWITLLDGFRPGRQLILTRPVTPLGRGDHLPLPLLGYAGRDLLAEHARIVRKPDGTYCLEDNGSPLGTLLNGKAVTGPSPLRDGDTIKLGQNVLRFSHRDRRARDRQAASGLDGRGTIPPPPPPPSASPPATVQRSVRPPVPGELRISPPPPPPGIPPRA